MSEGLGSAPGYQGIPRPAALPLGILMVGLGSVLLFVAFHNLPSEVDSFGGFTGYLADGIRGGTFKGVK